MPRGSLGGLPDSQSEAVAVAAAPAALDVAREVDCSHIDGVAAAGEAQALGEAPASGPVGDEQDRASA